MPQHTTPAVHLETVENAYKTAGLGRRQGAVAGARLHTQIAGGAQNLTLLRDAAFAWLVGAGDLPTNAMAATQAILKRLNLAIDGTGKPVTDILLTADQIERLRLFRTQVRNLMTSAPRPLAPTKGRDDFPQPQSRGIADGARHE